MPSGPKTNAPAVSADSGERIRAVMERVKDAMLTLMEDEEAAPTARATAARALSLIERDEVVEPAAGRPLDTVSIAELDAMIAAELQRLGRKA